MFKYWVFFLALILYLLLTFRFLFTVPVPWPDEAIYADVAKNLAFSGYSGTALWEGSIPFVERRVLWYPPVFINLTALIFKVFGVDLLYQRLSSVIAGFLVLLVFSLIARRRGVVGKMALLLTLFLSVDTIFLKSARLSRPEIFVLLFILISVFCFLNSGKASDGLGRRIWVFLAGLFAALAFMTHFMAVIFVFVIGVSLAVRKWKKQQLVDVFYFLLPIAALVTIWLISVWPDLDILFLQNYVVGLGRGFNESWIWHVFQVETVSVRVLLLGYLLLSLVFGWETVRSRKGDPILFFALLLVSWGMAFFGRIEWYYVYLVPFVYLGILSTAKSKMVTIGLVLVLGSNFAIHWHNFRSLRPESHSFDLLSRRVLELVPDHKSIYLSSLPDIYFALAKRKNRLYEFPAVPMSVNGYVDYLDKVDYAVVNSVFSYYPAPQIFDRYVRKNAVKIVGVDGGSDQYSVAVIEFMPRDRRVRVGLE